MVTAVRTRLASATNKLAPVRWQCGCTVRVVRPPADELVLCAGPTDAGHPVLLRGNGAIDGFPGVVHRKSGVVHRDIHRKSWTHLGRHLRVV